MVDYFREFPILTIWCAIDFQVVARSFTYGAFSSISEKTEHGGKSFFKITAPGLSIKTNKPKRHKNL